MVCALWKCSATPLNWTLLCHNSFNLFALNWTKRSFFTQQYTQALVLLDHPLTSTPIDVLSMTSTYPLVDLAIMSSNGGEMKPHSDVRASLGHCITLYWVYSYRLLEIAALY